MRHLIPIGAVLTVAILNAACGSPNGGTQSAEPLDPAAYTASVEQWRADREANLKAEDGWLTLVGLHWIEEGASRVGSAPDAEVPLPASLPAEVGTIMLAGGKARFEPAPGVALEATALIPDTEDDYTVLRLDSVRFYLIERGGRYGIRVKDTHSPALLGFSGLNWYPVDPAWRIEADFVPSPHTVTFDTDVGVRQTGDSPGYLEFARGGQSFRIEPVEEEGELFIVMRDQTSGKTTYGASRFLYTGLPRDGKVTLDFNQAYNPPCVFTDYATCPLPPPENRLAMAVTAGEQIYQRGY